MTDKQICWTYYLACSEEDKKDISSCEFGLYGIHKDGNHNYFYSIGEFHGPVINFVMRDKSGLLLIRSECSHRLLEVVRENYIFTDHLNLSAYEKLQVIINSFINYPELAGNINIVFKSDSGRCLVNAKNLIEFTLHQYESRDRSGYDSVEIDCKKYFNLEFHLVLSFAIEMVDYKLNPYIKKEVVFFEVDEDSIKYIVDGLFVPSVLEYYMYNKFNNYLPRCADEGDDLHVGDDIKDDYYLDNKSWVRDELDDMHQADPNWHWNID